VTVLFLALAMAGVLSHWHGLILILVLIGFTYLSYRNARRKGAANGNGDPGGGAYWKLAGLILIGLIAVIVGSQFLVSGAVDLARAAGVSEAVIGLTLVAFGTSLPELATAVVAAYRRHPEVAVGNVIGANIFNLLAIGGVVSIVSPLAVPAEILAFDVWVMLGVTLVVVPLMMFRCRLDRRMGMVLLVCYAGYIWSQFTGLPGVG
jgi:cation:H+ antiporter